MVAALKASIDYDFRLVIGDNIAKMCVDKSW